MFFFVRSFWWNCTSQLYGIDASWQEERLKDEGTKYRRMKVWGGMREGDDQLIPEEKFGTSGWGTSGRERIGLGSSRSSNSASSRQFCKHKHMNDSNREQAGLHDDDFGRFVFGGAHSHRPPTHSIELLDGVWRRLLAATHYHLSIVETRRKCRSVKVTDKFAE